MTEKRFRTTALEHLLLHRRGLFQRAIIIRRQLHVLGAKISCQGRLPPRALEDYTVKCRKSNRIGDRSESSFFNAVPPHIILS